MENRLDIDEVARVVHERLRGLPPGTLVVVHPDGLVEERAAGEDGRAFGRRERPVAMFIATSAGCPQVEVYQRIRQGLQKRQLRAEAFETE